MGRLGRFQATNKNRTQDTCDRYQNAANHNQLCRHDRSPLPLFAPSRSVRGGCGGFTSSKAIPSTHPVLRFIPLWAADLVAAADERRFTPSFGEFVMHLEYHRKIPIEDVQLLNRFSVLRKTTLWVGEVTQFLGPGVVTSEPLNNDEAAQNRLCTDIG